uniref:Endonuclease/exonuclease/phosphatase domain-containing protein n=1 Tax=Felis catus TaxID=9685 RepID=A0ABI7WTS5_FELCA
MYQEDITIVHIYVPNIGEPKYIKQILTDLKGEMDNTIIVGDFNSPLSAMDRLSRHKINKVMVDLNLTLDQTDLNIYRTFHSEEQNTCSQVFRRTFHSEEHIEHSIQKSRIPLLLKCT